VVSHDRYFLNRVCTGILAFEGEGEVHYSVGDYDYYWEKRRRQSAPPVVEKAAAPVAAAAPAASAAPKARKLSFKETRELEGMEATILTTEERIAAIEAMFADTEFHAKHGAQASALHDEVEAARGTLEELYARWEALEAIKAAGRG